MDFLQTKFHKPRMEVTHFCSRDFIEAINEEERSPVWLLSAPAGYGKSSILAQWIDQSKGKTSFLSLDSYDNQSRHFWSYFIAAVQQVCPAFGKGALAQLNKAEFPGNETCLIPLINDLHDLDEPLTIILDDLHSIEEKEIFHGIDFFIDNLPEKVRLVLSTREDPPLSLGRLRASRKLREIRQDDLRFSLEESRRFLNQNSSYDISPKESEALFKRTEGWVTGLQLVVTALEPQENKEEFIRNFSGNHYYIFDYLIEEVLSNLDKEMQSFLFEISIFKEFSTALCDQYLGLSSKDLIRYTARANLFLIPLDMENRWYRFHHLFSDFLRNRLLDSLTTEERKNKFLRAFHALSGADRFDDAFQMGIAGELWDECVSLLCQRIPSFRSSARLYELDGYLKQLPEEMVLNNAELFALSRWNLVGVKKDDRIFKGTMTPLLEGVNYYMAGFDLISNGENSRESRKAY